VTGAALDLLQQALQHRPMKNETGIAAAVKNFVRWSITPPQSYAVYLVCLFLVAGVSFYAGSLRPKNAIGTGPPPASVPRN
jgi:hypothetical protein